MPKHGKIDVNQEREKMKDNLVKLLCEQKGRYSISDIWNAHNRKYKMSLSKRDLGFSKMSDLLDLYPNIFRVEDDHVVLINYKQPDKYGMPMPSPVKPLWGAGAATSGASSLGGHSTPQTRKGPAEARPITFTSNMSVSVSSSDTDSDSDIKITGQEPPQVRPGQRQPQQAAANRATGSDFLSFEVNPNQQHDSFDVSKARQRDPMVFTNQQHHLLLQQQQQYLDRLADQPTGRGRGMIPADQGSGRVAGGGQGIPPSAQLMGLRFPMPAHPNGGDMGLHPGVKAAFDVYSDFPELSRQQQQQFPQMRSHSQSPISHAQQQQQQPQPPPPTPPPPQPAQPQLPPPPLPPPEPTWPPNNPKLGIPPGVPRERKQVTVKPVPFVRGRLTKEQVEAVAHDCIEMLVEAGDHVSPSRVVQLLLQRYNVRDLRDLQVSGLRFPYNLTCINEHERLIAKINASVEAFVLSRSLCTLYDLEQSLLEYSGDKTNFESFRIGPLQCLPVVYEKFKFPQEEKIPDITTADVLEILSEYLTKKQKWTERLDMEEVMAYFVDHFHVSTAYSLGIRIRSLPLAAQVLKKSHRDAANTRKSVVGRCMANVENEVMAAFQKVRATMFETGAGENVELRRHYLGMHAEAVMIELLDKYRLLLSIDTPSSRVERRRHTNIEQAVTLFFTTIHSVPLARALLHLAVCVGRLDLQEAAMELLAPASAKEEHQAGDSSDKSSAEQSKAKQPPSKASLMDKVKRYIERCLEQGTLSLSHLERIEEKLLEDFDFPTFVAMGFGRFLHFMLHDPSPKALLEECGGVSLAGGGSQSQHAQGHAHKTEVLEFIRQCKATALTQESDMERVLCHQFHVTEARSLRYGNMRHLVESADKPGKHHSKDYRIVYETAFCGKSSEPLRGKREVGILGNQTRDAALACLQNCPLLEDLECWSHWSLVFEPQLGSLKDFLQKFGGVHTMHADGGQKTITTDVIALETEPGHLLRLVSTTTPSHFESSASRRDVRGTCGHLASLVIGNRGVDHTPLALLANHMRSALFVLHSNSSSVPGGPGAPTTEYDPAIQFVLQCLLLLPLRMCVAVANQVFLEPLGQVVGSSRSKTLLLDACSTSYPIGKSGATSLPLMELARLGCMLGVQEWTQPLTRTFSFPPECVTLVMPAAKDKLLGDDGEVEEEEEESEEESEEEESTSSFLSDEEEDEKKEGQKAEGAQGSQATDKVAAAIAQETESSEETDDSSEDEDDDDDDNKEEEEGKEKKEDNVSVEEKMEESVEKEVSAKTGKRNKTTDDSGINAEDKVSNSESDNKEEEASKEGMEAEEEEVGTEEEEEKEETEEDRCQRIIKQIQREEFGIGVELNEDGQRLMKVQQERLGRSLDRLSRDLYSKDTHFVLELVQNADDNSYPEELLAALQSSAVSQACPAVRFVINENGVVVLNNESGFQEKDIRALCDVGRSTKGKHKYGYIGQKGIGFKSVFRVTNRPEVHSNSFHMCFDVDSGPTGYILPHWCEDKDPQEGWMTKIVLPLKKEMVSEARSLAARFNDIHPSLLLFLHRLRSIYIDNKVERTEQSIRRVDLGDNIVEIHHGQGSADRWLVVKKRLDASAISLQAKSGVEVESTEIALAFPLQANRHPGQVQPAPAKQPVFAFLPLRSYGFRFIVQGDFDVPSSREDVDRDSSWNQWLRSEIHTLFVEAFDIFRAHPEFQGLQSLWCYLQFVPLEDEILDFFKPVATHILQKLRATPCIPIVSTAATNKKGNSAIQWKLPSQTIMGQDLLVREVVPPELLERHLGLHYVHHEVATMLSPLLATSLGVQTITTDHLIQVGRSLAASWGDSVEDEEVVHIAKWLACVHRSMDDFHEHSSLIKTLQGMRLIPLSTGQLVSLDEMTVFMLSDAGTSTAEKLPPGRKDPLSVLRQDLKLVHGRLMATPDNEVNSQVTKMLHKLDIKQLTAHDIVHHHILPILRSDTWQKKSPPVLVSYLTYIKEERSRNNSLINMGELKAVARVLTNHGIKNPATQNVHFTSVYGIGIDLRAVLPGYDWTLLDGQYLPYNASKAEVQSWQEFFSLLGVAIFLIVRREEVKFKRDEMEKTPWAPMKDLWPSTEDSFVVQDFACEELQQLVSNNIDPQTLNKQMNVLFTLLDSSWDKQYSKYANSQLLSGSSNAVLRDNVPSSFAMALQTLSWVPGVKSTVMNFGDTWKIEEEESLFVPSVLYLPDPQIKRLLAHTAHYLAVKVSNTSSFSRFLLIKSTVEEHVVCNALIEWGKRDPKSPNQPAIFYTSLAHMKQVYSYLFDTLKLKEGQDLFHNNTVIWVPVAENIKSYDQIPGRMLGREEVWWQDISGLFQKYRTSLVEFHSPLADRHPVELFYRDMKEKFLGSARLQQGPSQEDFANLLVLIAAAYNLKEEGVLSDALSIYARIGEFVSTVHDADTLEFLMQKEQKDKVTRVLKSQKVLASKKHTWVSPQDKPMLADDSELEKMFSSKDAVHFVTVELPKAQQRTLRGSSIRRRMGGSGRDTSSVNVDDVLAFMALFNIPQLSEEVEKQEIPEMFVPCPTGQQYLRLIIPYVQRYLVSFYPDIQSTQHRAGMSDRLKSLLFVKTKRLQVRYSLKSLPDVYEIRDEKCVIMQSHFYFHEKHVESLFEVNKEVARFFSDGNTDCMKDLRQFLMELEPLVKDKNEEKELKRMLERSGVEELPDTHLVWMVPAPIIPKPPTPPPLPPPPPAPPKVAADRSASGEQGEGSGLRSWPPQAPGERTSTNAPKKTGEGKTLGTSMWPPPKAPDEAQRRRDLPSNLHVAPMESSDSANQDSTEQSPHSTPGGGQGSAGSAHPASGSARPGGSGHAHSDQPRLERMESGERPPRRDQDDGEGRSGGGEGVVYRRQDSGASGERRQDGSVPGKRKSEPLDVETSESKRPVPSEGVPGEATAASGTRMDVGDTGAPPQNQGGEGVEGAMATEEIQQGGSSSSGNQPSNQPRMSRSIARPGWPPYRPKPDHLQLPIWTQLASETEYEELGRGNDLKIPTSVELSESSNRVEIGRWGEQLVYDYLLHQKSLHSDIYDVIWTNEVQESGKPYDFEVICTPGDEAYTLYIEVKATRSSKKEVFEISSNEVKFANEQSDRYHIYRIFNAGVTGQVQLVRLANISHKLDTKEVRLLMVI